MAYSFRDYLQPTKKLNVAGQAGSKKGVACNFIWLYYTNVGAWAFNLTSVVVARNYLASGWQLVNHDSLAALPFPQLLQLPYPTSSFRVHPLPKLNLTLRFHLFSSRGFEDRSTGTPTTFRVQHKESLPSSPSR